MKHILKYNDILLPGYYVILDYKKLKGYGLLIIPKDIYDFKNFIENNIGHIRSFHHTNNGETILNVNYEKEPPKNIKKAFMYDKGNNQYYISTYKNKVIEFGKTLEDLEMKLQAKKYNL